MKKILVLLSIIASLAATSAFAADKAEVEKIVHDYIMNHADVILKSVEDYQKKDRIEQQSAALKEHGDKLFKNETAPFAGNPDGDVVMFEFFDYNCHFCKDAFSEIKKLLDADKNLKIVFFDFPILGPSSEEAAKWALAAQKQGKYFEFHQGVMEHKGVLDDDALEEIAENAGLDVAKVKADIKNADIFATLEKTRTLAGQLGIGGTPGFILGDQVFSGGLSADNFKTRIEDIRKSKTKK